MAFLDGEQVADWAAGYVSVMSDRGILNGVGGNQFAPLEDINRASVVTVLNNAVTAYANEPGATVQASGGIALVVAEDVTVTGTAEDVLIVAGGDVTVARRRERQPSPSAPRAPASLWRENAVVGTVAVSGGSAAGDRGGGRLRQAPWPWRRALRGQRDGCGGTPRWRPSPWPRRRAASPSPAA